MIRHLIVATILLWASPLFAGTGHSFVPTTALSAQFISANGYYVYNTDAQASHDVVADVKESAPATIYVDNENPAVGIHCRYTSVNLITGATNMTEVYVFETGPAQRMLNLPDGGVAASTLWCTLPPTVNGVVTKIFGYTPANRYANSHLNSLKNGHAAFWPTDSAQQTFLVDDGFSLQNNDTATAHRVSADLGITDSNGGVNIVLDQGSSTQPTTCLLEAVVLGTGAYYSSIASTWGSGLQHFYLPSPISGVQSWYSLTATCYLARKVSGRITKLLGASS